ncbi:MAG: hypothetical protein ACOZAO_00935 [Patescibacteria group bacterium]
MKVWNTLKKIGKGLGYLANGILVLVLAGVATYYTMESIVAVDLLSTLVALPAIPLAFFVGSAKAASIYFPIMLATIYMFYGLVATCIGFPQYTVKPLYNKFKQYTD